HQIVALFINKIEAMNNIKNIFFFLGLTFFIFSCNGKQEHQNLEVQEKLEEIKLLFDQYDLPDSIYVKITDLRHTDPNRILNVNLEELNTELKNAETLLSSNVYYPSLESYRLETNRINKKIEEAKTPEDKKYWQDKLTYEIMPEYVKKYEEITGKDVSDEGVWEMIREEQTKRGIKPVDPPTQN
ncbi:MAG: hypothetical protein AAFO07_25145, partial [Bacteroidota bacterium]